MPASAGIEVVRNPPRGPRANAYAGRWAPTVRSEVTGRMLIAGPRHLRAVPDGHAAHYNRHRPHRARILWPPDCADVTEAPVTDPGNTRVRRRDVLGRLIHEYGRGGMKITSWS